MEITFSTLASLYIIMLGPFKLILPFANLTANAAPTLRRQLALRTTMLSTSVALLCVLVGGVVMSRLDLSAGTLLVAMSAFLAHHGFVMTGANPPGPGESSAPANPSLALAVFPLSFPGVIPRQGFALLLFSSDYAFLSSGVDRLFVIVGLVLGVMASNWVSMLSAAFLLKLTGATFWLLLGRFLGAAYVALAVHIFFMGLGQLGILTY